MQVFSLGAGRNLGLFGVAKHPGANSSGVNSPNVVCFIVLFMNVTMN
jgi:hypothetical protein